MPAIYEHPHIVLASEIDDQGHVNNVEYVKWMNWAAVTHSSLQGWPPERYREVGAGWVVRTHRVEYLQAAFEGDEIVVRTWVADFKKVTSTRKYRILRRSDKATLVIAETNWAFIGLEHHVPRRIPPELSGAFELVPDDAES